MDIKDEREKPSNILADLFVGEVFIHAETNILCMKVSEIASEDGFAFNAVRLASGTMEAFDEDEKVIPVVGQFRILRNA